MHEPNTQSPTDRQVYHSAHALLVVAIRRTTCKPCQKTFVQAADVLTRLITQIDNPKNENPQPPHSTPLFPEEPPREKA